MTLPAPEPWLFLVAVAGVGAVLLRRQVRPSGAAGRCLDALLIALGAVALAGWFGFGNSPFTGRLHAHEWVHYYLGSKYSAELSYERLYECITVADLQDGAVRRDEPRPITDLRTNRRTSAEAVLAEPARCTDHFSAPRWASFRADVGYFRNTVDDERWRTILVDHGYNATPVWTVVGGLLANTGPASDLQITLLGLLDPLWLLAVLLAIGVTFGPRTLAVSVIVMCTYLPAEYAWTGRAFLRWDWLFCLVLAVCLLKRGRPLPAGVALGCAAALRIFPAALFAGAVIAAIVAVVGRRRLDRAWPRFFAGGIATMVLLTLISVVALGGFETHHAFVANAVKTAGTPFANAIGLPSLLGWRPGEGIADLYDPAAAEPLHAWLEARRDGMAETVAVRLAVAAGFCVLFALATRRARPWLVVALATTLLPVTTDLLGYYYLLIVATALVHHDSELDASWLLTLTAASQFIGLAAIPGMPTSIDQQYALISAVTLVAFAAMLIRRAVQARGPSPEFVVTASPDDGSTKGRDDEVRGHGGAAASGPCGGAVGPV